MFYEMLSRFEYDTFFELPNDIKDFPYLLNKSQKIDLCNEDTSVLDSTWEKTKEICSKYINAKWINDLGIDKSDLTDDIKDHCIFVIYLSIINRNFEQKPIDKCFDEYYETTDMIDEPEKLRNSFNTNLDEWLDKIDKGDYSKGFSYSDMYYFLSEGYQKEEDGNNFTNLYFEILYMIVNNWRANPYNIRNSGGMTFKQLFKYYRKFYNSKGIINRTIKTFTLERLFNFSFLMKLTEYVNKDYKQKVERYKIGVEIYEGRLKDKCDQEHVKGLMNGYDSIDSSAYHNYKIYAANKLLILSEIASIPMVFSRDKYIDIFDKIYEDKIDEETWRTKLSCNIYYLNNYLIPLLARQYYLMLFYRYNNEKDTHSIICNLLENYIKDNSSKYDYNKLLVNENNIQNDIESQALQVNATNIVYNYCNYRTNFYRDNYCEEDEEYNNYDIFNNMKQFEKETVDFINLLDTRYNYYTYQDKFPFNKIYLNYKWKN